MLYKADHALQIETSLHGGVKNNFTFVFSFIRAEGGWWAGGRGRGRR